MENPTSHLLEFGDFRLDLEERLLFRRDGTELSLTPRVFETLRYLVDHRGRVLDKEQIMEAVWPDCIVEENNLAQSISTLRRIFGETPGSHRYIATVPGRGYRFLADVRSIDPQMIGAPASVSSGPLETAPERRGSSAAWGRFALTGVALALVIGVGFMLSRGRAKSPANLPLATRSIPEKSIAVLPFDNRSSDAENVYFAAGVQDEILSKLAKIADLKVISRTSANLYQSGNPRNLREIGEQLGVAHLLEGSVQRVGNRLRVNAQLIDARSDAHLWAQSYDRELKDVFAIQSEIAEAIVQQLQARLAPEEKAGLETKPTTNPDAYLAYLKAVEQTRVANSRQSALAADELYSQAIAADPSFALAHARGSMLNSLIYQLGREPLRKTKAREMAETALRLAPGLAEAHVAVGVYLYRTEENFDAASIEFGKAGTISKNDPEILQLTSAILRRQGRWREALSSAVRAQQLDPRHVHLYGTETHMQLRDWPAAAASYRELIKAEPDLGDNWVGLAWLEVLQNSNPAAARAILDKVPPGVKRREIVELARWDLAMLARDFSAAEQAAPDFPAEEFPVREPKIFYQALALFARGDIESARTQLETLRPMHEVAAREHPDNPQFHAILGTFYSWLGRTEDAIRESERAVELCPLNKNAVNGASYLSSLALVYARSGEPDRAIPLIERLLATPAATGITLAELRLRWEWDPLRSDPRFQKIANGPEPQTAY